MSPSPPPSIPTHRTRFGHILLPLFIVRGILIVRPPHRPIFVIVVCLGHLFLSLLFPHYLREEITLNCLSLFHLRFAYDILTHFGLTHIASANVNVYLRIFSLLWLFLWFLLYSSAGERWITPTFLFQSRPLILKMFLPISHLSSSV